jgi:hypothetical protein
MKKFFVDEKGNINPNFSLFIGLIGVGLIFLAFYFVFNFYLSIIVIFVGCLLIAFSGYSTQSATLDLRTFTRDPLGWRKSKQSYEANKPLDSKGSDSGK